MRKLKEECGVFGVYAGGAECDTNLADTCYYGLFALQHRGQESCGIVINDDGIFRSYKDCLLYTSDNSDIYQKNDKG